jgi:type I restriction enzyme S subunit
MIIEKSAENPHEGYKETQIGPREVLIPEDWDIRPANELFQIKKDSFDPDNTCSDTDVVLYSMPAFDAGNEPIRTPVSNVGSKKYHVPENTLLFPKLNIRKRRFWRVKHSYDRKAVCSTEFWPLVPQKSVLLDFYRYYFDSYEFMSNPKVTSSSSTNSHKRVNQKSFEKVRLPVPPLAEQRRIAEILSTVDEQIHQTEDVIETTRELKRGFLQDFYYSPEHGSTTTDDPSQVPETWVAKRIDEICEIGGGSTPKKSNQEFWGGDMPWCSPKEFDEDGVIHDTEDHVTEDGIDEASLTVYPEGTTLVTVRSNAIKRRLPIAKIEVPATVNQDLKALVPDEEQINAEYLFQILHFNSERIRLTCRKSGTTIDSIDTTALSKYQIMVPPLEVQQQFTDTLSTIDQKTQQEQYRKQTLQQLKRGLMQDLLTGKRRVETDE